jgi:ABC-type uncharacterized transport system ATPase subunit
MALSDSLVSSVPLYLIEPEVARVDKTFLLAVEALTVSFDGFKAVNDVSFYVDPDEIRS